MLWSWILVEILKLVWSIFWILSLVEMLRLGRYSEDEFWSRFVFEIVIWTKQVTLVCWTQPSGPLCLGNVFIFGFLWWFVFQYLILLFSTRDGHNDVMVGSKASDIAKGLALIVEVAAIFWGFAVLATTFDHYAFDEQFHNKNKTNKTK